MKHHLTVAWNFITKVFLNLGSLCEPFWRKLEIFGINARQQQWVRGLRWLLAILEHCNSWEVANICLKRCISISPSYRSNISYTPELRSSGLDFSILNHWNLVCVKFKSKKHDVTSNLLLKQPRWLRGILLILHAFLDVFRKESKRRKWSEEDCPGRSQVDFHTCQLESRNNGHAKLVCVCGRLLRFLALTCSECRFPRAKDIAKSTRMGSSERSLSLLFLAARLLFMKLETICPPPQPPTPSNTTAHHCSPLS